MTSSGEILYNIVPLSTQTAVYADYSWTLNTEFSDFNLHLPSNQLLFKITKQFNLFPSFTLAASDSAAATDTQV